MTTTDTPPMFSNTNMHISGYYPSPTYSDHHQAQIDMIDRTLAWAYQTPTTSSNTAVGLRMTELQPG